MVSAVVKSNRISVGGHTGVGGTTGTKGSRIVGSSSSGSKLQPLPGATTGTKGSRVLSATSGCLLRLSHNQLRTKNPPIFCIIRAPCPMLSRKQNRGARNLVFSCHKVWWSMQKYPVSFPVPWRRPACALFLLNRIRTCHRPWVGPLPWRVLFPWT